MYSPGYPSGL
jgi:hypothetical protein